MLFRPLLSIFHSEAPFCVTAGMSLVFTFLVPQINGVSANLVPSLPRVQRRLQMPIYLKQWPMPPVTAPFYLVFTFLMRKLNGLAMKMLISAELVLKAW